MNPEEQKFINYSNASKARQAAIPKHIRTQRAKAAANAKWANVSYEDRRKHALLMVEGRIWKQKNLQKKNP